MNHDHYSDNYIRGILESVKTIAISGASANSARPSFNVAQFLMARNYQIFPVNPGQAGKDVAGSLCYASLTDIPQPIHMIDIFRNSEAALSVVKDALELNSLPKAIWMQLDIRNDEAAILAEKNGIKVVMNRCSKIEYKRLMIETA